MNKGQGYRSWSDDKYTPEDFTLSFSHSRVKILTVGIKLPRKFIRTLESQPLREEITH